MKKMCRTKTSPVTNAQKREKGDGESQKHTQKEERRVGVVNPPPENFGGVVEGKIQIIVFKNSITLILFNFSVYRVRLSKEVTLT